MKTVLLMIGFMWFVTSAANADDSDNLLKSLLAKSKLVVVGQIISPPIGLMGQAPVTSWGFQFGITKVVFGASPAQKQVSVFVQRPRITDGWDMPWLKQGADCILFLTPIVEQDGSITESASDNWFGVEPYSAGLEQAVVRLTNLPTPTSGRPSSAVSAPNNADADALARRRATNLARREAELMQEERKLRGQYTQRGASLDGWAIAASAQEPVTMSGQTVVVTVSMRNTTPTAQMYVLQPPEECFRLTVTGPLGRKVALTHYGKELYEEQDEEAASPYVSGRTFLSQQLRSGQARHEPIVVSRLYDMTKAGVYLVRVHQVLDMPDGRGPYLLISDPVQVVVKPKRTTENAAISMRFSSVARVYATHRNAGSIGPSGEPIVWNDGSGGYHHETFLPYLVYGTTFVSGSTNVLYNYTVNVAGTHSEEVSSMFGIRGGPSPQPLSAAAMASLRAAIAHLPPGLPRPPLSDLLILSVRDGNAWKTRDYDLRHVPSAVDDIYRIGGAPVPRPL